MLLTTLRLTAAPMASYRSWTRLSRYGANLSSLSFSTVVPNPDCVVNDAFLTRFPHFRLADILGPGQLELAYKRDQHQLF